MILKKLKFAISSLKLSSAKAPFLYTINVVKFNLSV